MSKKSVAFQRNWQVAAAVVFTSLTVAPAALAQPEPAPEPAEPAPIDPGTPSAPVTPAGEARTPPVDTASPDTTPPAGSEPAAPLPAETEPPAAPTGATSTAASNPEGDATIANEPAAEPEPPWTEHLQLKGDLRYRFETIQAEDDELRHRQRIRARFGLHAAILDDLDAVIALGTGDTDIPNSNNQTLDTGFSSKRIWLDLGYFDYHPGYAEGLSLVGGKMKMPLYKVGKSELLWDPDINPEGLALSFDRGLGVVSPFAHAALFWVEERGDDPDTVVLGSQLGLRLELADGAFYAIAGGGYVDYAYAQGAPIFWHEEGDDYDSFGNSATEIDDVLYYDYDYNLVDGFVEVGGKIASLPWSFFGDIVTNTAVDDGNWGWLVGASVGQCKETLSFCLRYIYREVEPDAVVGVFTDSDFVGGGTDGKGHEWNAGLQVAKRVEVAATYFYNFQQGETYHRQQTDLVLKF